MQSVTKNARSATFYIEMLNVALLDHPDFKSEVQKMCRYLDRKYLQRLATPDDVRIVNAIIEGCATARDIAKETLIPYATVSKALKRLQAIGAITSIKAHYDSGIGGDKKTIFYRAANDALAVAVIQQQATAVRCRISGMEKRYS